MSTEPTSTETITESAVVAWLLQKTKELRAKFGDTHYATAIIDVYLSSNHGGKHEVRCAVGSGALTTNYYGATFDEALAKAESESPATIAAGKRAMAERLLSEAEALAPKPEKKVETS